MTDGRRDSRDTRGQERLVSVKDAAAILGVSERTVRRKIAANDLPSVKSGTARLIPDSALTLSSHDDTPDTPSIPAVVTPLSVDLSPLAAVIERQAAEIARLTGELATAQERLRALGTGQDAPETTPNNRGEAIGPTPMPDASPENARPGATGEATGAAETSESHRESIGPPAWRRADEGHELGPDRDAATTARPWWRFWGR